MITQELLKNLLDYDAKTGFLYRKTRTSNRINLGKINNLPHPDGYIYIRIMGKKYPAHRLAWMIYHGYRVEHVDHINGIRHDNSIDNLRACTQSENSYNTCIRSDNKTGVKGVSWHKYHNKWQARIMENKVEHHIGYFNNFDDAVLAMQDARNKYHGEFYKER